MRSIVILAGASGVGKTSVAAEILSRNDEYRLIRSATTRAPRGDSHDGEYIYVSEEEFKELIFRGELLEYMNYGGNFYGTPVSEINLAFSLGKTPLLILDIEGVKSLREKKLDFSVYVFYIYEDLNVIEKRLYDREMLKSQGIKSLDTFIKRKSANIRDYSMLPEIADKFDAFIKNSEISLSAEEIIRLHSELLSGKVKDENENLKIAEELSLSAKLK